VFIDVVVTSEEWDNFFELRDHDDADPNFHALASKMHKALKASTPRGLGDDPMQTLGWHLPYVSDEERALYSWNTCLMASAARCARVSYKPFDSDTADFKKDLELCRKLAGGRPLHASPFEHQAYFRSPNVDPAYRKGNFPNWVQQRTLLELDKIQY
jgi:thymidylate synthase ThyX